MRRGRAIRGYPKSAVGCELGVLQGLIGLGRTPERWKWKST
jgi:hypothetical protein